MLAGLIESTRGPLGLGGEGLKYRYKTSWLPKNFVIFRPIRCGNESSENTHWFKNTHSIYGVVLNIVGIAMLPFNPKMYRSHSHTEYRTPNVSSMYFITYAYLEYITRTISLHIRVFLYGIRHTYQIVYLYHLHVQCYTRQ